MAFKAKTNANFKMKVIVVSPNEDGTTTKEDFTGIFKILPNDEVRALESDSEIAEAVLVSAEGVTDATGAALTGEEAVKVILSDFACVTAVAATYFHARGLSIELIRKSSKRG